MANNSNNKTSSRSSKDEVIIHQAKTRYKWCQEWEAKARENFAFDFRFCQGDSSNLYQWPDDLVRSRQADGKPCLTVNKTRQHALQIINDGRQNESQIKIRAIGNGATFEGANIYEGVVRHIEYQSNAQAAYFNACYSQIIAGIGYLRVTTDYAHDDSFDQEIYIRRVRDPLSIYLDPDIMEFDGSDAKFGIIFKDMTEEEYKAEYGDIDDIDGGDSSPFGFGDDPHWRSEDHIKVAEYYRKVNADDKLHLLDNGDTVKESDVRKMDQEVAGYLDTLGRHSVKIRDISQPKIEWYLIAGSKVIDRKEWPGKYIPIVRVVGEETVIDGQMDRKGHVRNLIDIQRMYNYWTPLSLDTPLPTPTGWTSMGRVMPGDLLLDEKGRPCEVAGLSPVYDDHDCYKVEFDDGSNIIADASHLWTVEERRKVCYQSGPKKGSYWDTKTLSTDKLEAKKHFITLTAPLDLDSKTLSIDPYHLGVWLGDGGTDEPQNISSGFEDMEEMRQNLIDCGCENVDIKIYENAGCAVLVVRNVRHKFTQLDLRGHKHIPAHYLRASYQQRLALLQGLMDTDGSYNRANNVCSFTTANPLIEKGFIELLRTLGIKPMCSHHEGKERNFPNNRKYMCKSHTEFRFTADPGMQIFRLKRKMDYQISDRETQSRRTKQHKIIAITKVPTVPVRCVAINSKSHLFLAGHGMIPTHNSSATEHVALQTKTPWVAEAAALAGYEEKWALANTENLPVLPYNGWDNIRNRAIDKPARESPPVMAPAYINGLKITQEEFMLASGQYEANMGQKSNEVSGKAVQERQRQGDNATYQYIDHFSQAIMYIGRILIDLIPKIYDVPRILKILGQDGSEKTIQLDPNHPQAHQQLQDPDDEDNFNPQEVASIFNPNIGKYAVEADIGPAFATKRQETFNALMQLMGQNKDLTAVAGDLLFKAADFPMADELAKRMKNMLPPQALGQKQDDPQIQQLQMMLAKQHESMTDLQHKLSQAEQKASRNDPNLEWYDAETRRMTAVGKIDPDALRPIVRELVSQALGTPVNPLIAQHALENEAMPGSDTQLANQQHAQQMAQMRTQQEHALVMQGSQQQADQANAQDQTQSQPQTNG